MPLLDHFHPPLAGQRDPVSFLGRWMISVCDWLNSGTIPAKHLAEAFLRRGGRVRPDEETPDIVLDHVFEMDASFPDEIELQVVSFEAGPHLIGAVLFVSPANKDRPANRRAFAVKCLSYLQNGIGLIVADIVTERHVNLHDEMADLIVGDAPRFPGSPGLYAVAYRPFKRGEEERIGVWPVELTLGAALPVLPLWLRNHETAIRIDLESAYTEACQKCVIE